MASAFPNIITKVLLPNRRPTLLHRNRLVDFIHDHIERKAILISAGAGYGKTSLLTDYIHDTELPVCWLSLDEGDQDLPVFIEYLLRAIQHRFPSFGQHTFDLLRSGEAIPDTRALVGALASDIYEGIPGYFVLVLDDYHSMDESLAVNGFVDLLLRHLPENCHIILSSRTLPTKLTLTRLVAQQQIAGLGVSDMRFTAGEIKALLKKNYDTELTDSQANEIAQRSEGWITGILLTSHNLWGGLFRNLIQVQGDEGQVFDYLASEVFARQPPDIQRFLIATSVLDRMSPDLCNELLGINNASEILRTLENRNLFTFQLENKWYRYHQLFQAFLASRGQEDDPEGYQALQGRAGQLLNRRGLITEAIALFLAGAYWEQAAESIQRAISQAWEKGQWTTLSRWIDTLPPSLLPRYPWLPHYRGKVFMEAGDYASAREWFDIAKDAFQERRDQAGLAHTLTEEAFIWQNSGNYEQAIGNARRALSMLNGDNGSIIAGLAHRYLGISCVMQGNPDQAIKELLQALSIYEHSKYNYDMALTHHDLGLAYERIGNWGRSKMHLQQALKCWERVNNVAGLANTLNSLGVILHSEGNYAEALETLEQALHNIRLAGVPLTEAYILASLGDLYKELGEFGQALDNYEQALEIGKQHDLAFITLYALLAMGNIYSLQNNLDAASYYIDQAAEIARQSNSRYNDGLYRIARGIQLYRQNDLAESRTHLQAAIEILGNSGAKVELARAYLHLAQNWLLSHSPAQADACLHAVADLASDLDNQQFIVAEGRTLPKVIQRGIDQKIGGDFYQDIGARLRKLMRLKASNLHKEEMPSAMASTAALEAVAFGDSYVIKDGEPLGNAEWGASVAKELFFFLLDHPEGLRKDQILERIWHDTSPSKGNSNFHSTTYRIRRALYPECLVRESGLYRLQLDIPHRHDVAEFERLIEQVKTDPSQMEANFRRAIQIYRGDYMADIYADWCMERREQLRKTYAMALRTLANYHVEQNRYEESIPLFQKAAELDPFDEALHRQIMRCHALAEDRPGAIRCYQRYAQILRDELGVEPSQETQNLYQEILAPES